MLPSAIGYSAFRNPHSAIDIWPFRIPQSAIRN